MMDCSNIFKYLKDHSGAHISKVAEHIGLPVDKAEDRLRRLEKRGYVSINNKGKCGITGKGFLEFDWSNLTLEKLKPGESNLIKSDPKNRIPDEEIPTTEEPEPPEPEIEPEPEPKEDLRGVRWQKEVSMRCNQCGFVGEVNVRRKYCRVCGGILEKTEIDPEQEPQLEEPPQEESGDPIEYDNIEEPPMDEIPTDEEIDGEVNGLEKEPVSVSKDTETEDKVEVNRLYMRYHSRIRTANKKGANIKPPEGIGMKGFVEWVKTNYPKLAKPPKGRHKQYPEQHTNTTFIDEAHKLKKSIKKELGIDVEVIIQIKI